MTQRPLKLGVTLLGLNSVPEMVEEARQAEAAGFEVILLPDHLGFTAPLVPLVAIAEAHSSKVESVLKKTGNLA